MPSTHRNRLVTAISNAPGTSGALTIAAAASGYRTFGAADNGLSFDVSIVDGTAWEIRTGCVYTHSGTSLSRGTREDSSTGGDIALTSAAIVTVTMTAGMGNATESTLNNGFFYVQNAVSTSQSITAASGNKVAAALNDVVVNQLGWWDSTNKRFMPDRDGIYEFVGSVAFAATFSDGKSVQASIRKNATALYVFGGNSSTSNTGASPSVQVTAQFAVNAGDYVELFVFQNDTAARSTASDVVGRVSFSGRYIGAL